MKNYRYDGSFDGFLSTVFEAYKFRSGIASVSSEPRQIALDQDGSFIQTDLAKARRVEKYIRNEISDQFFRDVQACFLSSSEDKDTAAIKTIYKAIEVGPRVMDMMDDDVMKMRKYVKQVLGERHRYLGLVRFREMKDGTLLSTIEPKNDILTIIIPHFRERLRNERFAIFDKKRGMLAYYDTKDTEIFFTEAVNAEWSDDELVFAELWKLFHRTISIREKVDRKLQKGNLPKYYWKHLVEEMEDLEMGS
ncbi:MAG: TIGR03915 family putative DNA repair protein [Peptostreptococcaceae bacterium]|nr:TIGR03915 family putative DNA repair protein [Peptostreptococcaceae bacterium]